ncbi:DUF4166 domain-containing protein [Leucobacter allii]|uniref:DUF4166 domain-containing protein n=1 Tax=Leucobacter allii TaxID=2932247 RepID=UPI001FCFE5FD|nr:DUF4166 domain-containing protein [Leucobacter allii]UOR00707.1 DUF4166 domain-containing protein [Leucobacter allii]
MPPEEPRNDSPYARALGARVAELHPVLRSYFSGIPAGRAGVGEGTFASVGTPRRWLRPLLLPLQRAGIAHAGWAREVPFRIVNRIADGRVVSTREFALPGGTWTMRDAVGRNAHGGLVDELGPSGAIVASFDLSVADGGLRLRSRAVGIRIAGRMLRLPRAIAPVIRLHERFDEAAGVQRIDVTIDMPVVGRIYGYSGSFRYRIIEDADIGAGFEADGVIAEDADDGIGNGNGIGVGTVGIGIAGAEDAGRA